MSELVQFSGQMQTVGLDKLIGFTQSFVLAEVGRDVQTLVTEHLQKFDRDHPNKLGGKRTHWYGQMGQSVTLQSDERQAVITIHHLGVNQAVHGGPIKPVNGSKNLTLPAISEAHGLTVKDWEATHPSLVPVFTKKGGLHAYALAEARSTPVGRGAPKRAKSGNVRQKAESRGGSRVVFWLTPEVNQKPTPNVVPGDTEVLTSIGSTLDGLIGQANRITI